MVRLTLLFFLAVATFGVHAEMVVPSPPQLAAKAYLLVDAASGKVLVEHNADMVLPPARATSARAAACGAAAGLAWVVQ